MCPKLTSLQGADMTKTTAAYGSGYHVCRCRAENLSIHPTACCQQTNHSSCARHNRPCASAATACAATVLCKLHIIPDTTQRSVCIKALALQLGRMLVADSLGCIPGQQRAPPLSVETDVGGQHHSSSCYEIQDPRRKQPPWRLHTVSVH